MSPRSLLLAAAALAAPALAPAAQAQTTFGIKAGLNVSDFIGEDSDLIADDNSTDPRLGFSGGLFAEIPVTPSFSIQPEVLYSMKGVSSADDNNDATLALDYIEVPVLLKIEAPITDSGLLLGGYAGPSLGFKIRESIDSGSSDFDTDAFKDLDVGAAVGLTVGSGPFAIDGRYTFGLTNIIDSDVDDINIRNGVFTIAGVYRFGR